MMLIIGFKGEKTVSHLLEILKDENEEFDILDLESIKFARIVRIDFDNNLLLQIDNTTFDFNSYESFYCRYYYRDCGSKESNEAFFRLINCMSTYFQISASKTVVNVPCAGASNSSKLLQLLKLKEIGFSIPYSVVTGNEKFAKSVLEFDKSWISKGCSGERTQVTELDFVSYANLDQLKFCPCQFQKKISGENIRVHIIGDKCVSLRICTEQIDYRYNATNNTYEETDIPDSLKLLCKKYCSTENLLFAGFDFINSGNVWIILEANPMPGYDFYDRKLDNKISKALIELLKRPPTQFSIYQYQVDSPFIERGRRTYF